MGRKNRDWGQAPSVDDPGRASAIRDHTYRTSNGMWQLPKDSEIDAEIARLADQMAAELEITDAERSVVSGTDAAAEAEMRWAEADELAVREQEQRWHDAGRGAEDEDDGYGPGGAADPAWTGEMDDHEAEVEA